MDRQRTAEDKPQPWERQKYETSRSFAAFCLYRDLGPGRSIEAAIRLHAGYKSKKKTDGEDGSIGLPKIIGWRERARGIASRTELGVKNE